MTELTTSQKFDSTGFLKTLTKRPGVYRMLDSKGKVLYVGKAMNLKNRVSSYFRSTGLSPKTQVMMSHVVDMEVTVTNTENEALILESTLIKQLKPRYNILFRDDKSYPYIYIATEHLFPRISFHRGARTGKGRYYGPYPSSGAVRDALNLLQKIFHIRQCEDSYFNNRSRPCLQYQIKRCSAPCVGLIDNDAYARDVENAMLFLQGKSQQIIKTLTQRMDSASSELNYEQAAIYRDQIANLRKIQEKQYVSSGHGDEDVIACVIRNGVCCVQVFMIRGGLNLGNKAFFPKHTEEASVPEVLAAFIPQYYLGKPVPGRIILNAEIEDRELLESALSEQASHKISLSFRVKSERAGWRKLAEQNAENALKQYLSSKANMLQRYEALQDALDLPALPQRMECFDISHTRGEATIASCVVFDNNGPLKSDYRRFNIKDITAGDDFAAMEQALMRRYKRLKEGEGKLPDVLLIDGGKGQLTRAEKVIQELQISGVTLVGIAKGADRKSGMEKLFLSGEKQAFILPVDSPALHLIQQIRDEAHRFAITGHRQQRGKTRQTSVLESIPGLGPKRRQKLLKAFGGLQGVTSAGLEDLCKVNGVSKKLAEKIYAVLHSDE